MWTLDEIISHISLEIDQTVTNPSNSGAEYALRRTAVNRALVDYSEVTDWTHRIKEVFSRTSNLSASVNGLATISLPTDFKKLAGFPIISWDTDKTNNFGEIDVTDIPRYRASDKFVYILRSGATSTMIVHSSVVSGASIYFPYYSSPGSLASPTNIADIPDPTFLVNKALYYILKANEDVRYFEAEQRAELVLQRMIENEIARGVAYQNDRARTWLETKKNFRIGES